MAPGGLSLVLVGAQVALTTAAVVCTLLLWQSFRNVLRTESGIDPSGTIAFQVEMPAGTDFRTNDVVQRIEDALRAEPGLDAVGSTSHLPLRDFDGFLIPRERQRGRGVGAASGLLPSRFPRLFRDDWDAPLDGRAFTRADGVGVPPRRGQRAPRAIAVARRKGGRTPPPAAVRQGQSVADVVGVVATVRHFGLTADAEPEIFLPTRASVMTMVVKAGQPTVTEARIRALVHGVAPGVVVFDYTRVQDVLSRSYRNRWLQSLLALACAVVSIAVASTTIFAVIGLLLRARAREVRDPPGAGRHALRRPREHDARRRCRRRRRPGRGIAALLDGGALSAGAAVSAREP